jgi:hypothetical protein
MLWNKILMRLGFMSYKKTMATFTKAVDELKAMNDVHDDYIAGNLAVIDNLVAMNAKHTNARRDNLKAIEKLSEFLS